MILSSESVPLFPLPTGEGKGEGVRRTEHFFPSLDAGNGRAYESLSPKAGGLCGTPTKGIEYLPHFCYTNEIPTQKPMSIEACIAHAIHNDLDIIEALPEVHDLNVEDLEPYIESYIVSVQESLRRVISERGEPYLKAKDAAGLCATCLEEGIGLPPAMLLKMCQTILQLSTVDARFILDTDQGASLYYMKMTIA